MRSPFTIFALLLLSLGCGSTPAAGPRAGAGNDQTGVLIRVENGGSNPLRVFAVISREEMLLGRVDGLRTANFYLPEGIGGQMHLIVRPNASRGFGEVHASQPFSVSSGHYVEWQLRGASAAFYVPQISTISVYSCDGEDRC
jgi:hypothetical protein